MYCLHRFSIIQKSRLLGLVADVGSYLYGVTDDIQPYMWCRGVVPLYPLRYRGVGLIHHRGDSQPCLTTLPLLGDNM